MSKIKNRIGEINISNEGYKMLIIEYYNHKNIIVEFQDEYKARANCTYDNFKNGRVKNPYRRSVYGKGYLGEGKYSWSTHEKIYDEWNSMLLRCYDEKYHKNQQTYINCEVEEYLLNFQNFAQWYEENYYEIEGEKMTLDKDILFKGNKIYSRNTMIFVPQRINSLFVKCNKTRGNYPVGVNYHKGTNKLEARCSTLEKRINLGYFPLNKPFQAFTCYKNFKENYIKQVADEYKDLIPIELYEAMYKYEVEIND